MLEKHISRQNKLLVLVRGVAVAFAKIIDGTGFDLGLKPDIITFLPVIDHVHVAVECRLGVEEFVRIRVEKKSYSVTGRFL